jgi:hypothetical protein
MNESRKQTRAETESRPKERRRVIATGRRENGRWKVRTSLWRYLVETTISH